MSRPAQPVVERPGAVTITRTVSESDVYLFAGITGDLSPVHLDAEYASRFLGERVAHGALLLGLMSAAASKWCAQARVDALSYGYDRLRFIRPVAFGDTISVAFAPDREIDEEGKIVSAVEARNQHGTVVGTAEHILWRMRPTAPV